MRGIKFRGICNEEVHTHIESTEIGEFVYGFLVNPHTIRIKLSEEHGGIGPGFVNIDVEVLPKTVGQFTGLKNRNGKEIYEGDILQYSLGLEDYKIHVSFDEERGRWHLAGDYKYSETIGNIHQKPELLK